MQRLNDGDRRREGRRPQRGPHPRGKHGPTRGKGKVIYRTFSLDAANDPLLDRLPNPAPNAKHLYCRLPTSRLSNAIPGLFVGGPASVAEIMHWSTEATDACLRELEEVGLAEVDRANLLIWFPQLTRAARPENPNTVIGWANTLASGLFPDCELLDDAIIELQKRLRELTKGREAESEWTSPIPANFPHLFRRKPSRSLPRSLRASGSGSGSGSESESASSERALAREEEASVASLLGHADPEVMELGEDVSMEADTADPPAPPCPPDLTVVSPTEPASIVSDAELTAVAEVVVRLWNEHRGHLPSCDGLTRLELGALRRRLVEQPSLRDPERLRQIPIRARQSSFLAAPERMPPPSLGWFLFGEHLKQLEAGRYDDKPGLRTSAPPVDEGPRSRTYGVALPSWTSATPARQEAIREQARAARAAYERMQQAPRAAAGGGA